jgi:hypothetical protein
MWLDNVGQSFVDEFWRQCGKFEPFPRNLDRSLALALPIALVKLPRLRLQDIELWLQRRNVNFRFDCESRTVRGCLVAYGGQGLIFVDGTDPDDERRFTLAHEIGHFLSDYWQPRKAAINKYGDEITEVIDRIRPPTVSERIYALLASTKIKIHTDLMERNKRLNDMSGELWQIEDRADRIALALLAPSELVLTKADISSSTYSQRESKLVYLLQIEFGLPCAIAKSYSQSLLTMIGKGRSWLETMGLR